MNKMERDILHSTLTLGNKMGTARNIVLGCKNNIKPFLNKPKNEDELEVLVSEVTFIDFQSVRAINRSLKPRRTFKELFNNINEHKCIVPYDWFRNVIYKYYVTKEFVPTKAKLLHQISQIGGRDYENYTVDKLDNDLKAAGYLWKRLSNSKRAIIVEDPEQLYKRTMYLNKVRNFRHLKKIFVYVSFRIKAFSLSVSPITGVLRVGFKSIKSDNNEERANRELKFIENLIPHLPESCVVVLDSNDVLKPNFGLNPHSTKQQMKEWLDKHGLQYEESAHTAELYSLIQAYKNKYQDTCKISECLENQGFDVLRVPAELPQLNYFNSIFEPIKKLSNKRASDYISSVISRYSPDEYCALEDMLVEEEGKVYTEDLQIERIIDRIRLTADRNVFESKDLNLCGIYDRELPSYVILD